MTRTIDQIMEEIGSGSVAKRREIAHVVFILASEISEFDTGKLGGMARVRLANNGAHKPKP
jgi:hypothetical protein